MKIDGELLVVVGAVLIFYLRLILLQRERAKRLKNTPAPTGKKKNKAPVAPPRYTIFSQKRSDLVLGGLGVVLIVLGILLNTGLLPITSLQPYWWVPTAAGIILFSWAFRL